VSEGVLVAEGGELEPREDVVVAEGGEALLVDVLRGLRDRRGGRGRLGRRRPAAPVLLPGAAEEVEGGGRDDDHADPDQEHGVGATTAPGRGGGGGATARRTRPRGLSTRASRAPSRRGGGPRPGAPTARNLGRAGVVDLLELVHLVLSDVFVSGMFGHV